MPEVSIILPTYNRPDWLERALDSIAAQTYKNFEVVVANDAGQDVQPVVDKFSQRMNITYVTAKSNRGLAATRNLAISHAKGTYLAYLDDDDIFLPNHLDELVRFIQSGKNKVVYSDAYRAIYSNKNGILKRQTRKVPFSKDFSLDTLLSENLAPVNCYLHERKCLEKTGLFDETLHTHEDWDFWIRMGQHFPFAHLKTVTSEVSFVQQGGSMTNTRQFSFEHTRLLLFKKYEKLIGDEIVVRLAQQKAMKAMLKKYRPVLEVYQPGLSTSISDMKFNQMHEALLEYFGMMADPQNKLASKYADAYYQAQKQYQAMKFLGRIFKAS